MNPPEDFDSDSVKPVVRQRRAEREAVLPPDPTAEDQAAEGPAPQQRPSQGRQSQTRPAQDRSDRPERPVPQAPAATPPRRPRHASPDDEYVVLPPPTQGGRRLLAIGGLSVLLIGIVLGGLMIWASRQINPSGPQGEAIESLVIPAGATTGAISTQLADAGVISDSRMFTYYANWKDEGPWNAGEYVDFRESSSFDEAIVVLDGGPIPVEAKVVRITEGTRLADVLTSISEQMGTVTPEQLQETLDSGQVLSDHKPADVASWEGFLFPDTYEFEQTATPQVILQTLATNMDGVLDELGYDKAEALQGRSAYELVTIASLIEKETGAPLEERGMISRVISNRLDDGETLGIDASVLYGLGRSSGELTKSDLEQDTPYNTRQVKGLPPTPIAVPGRASLEAAIEPTEGGWKYYVLTSTEPPAHFFTDSYGEFQDAKDDAQARGVF